MVYYDKILPWAPNKETEQAILDAENGVDIKTVATVDELIDELESD